MGCSWHQHKGTSSLHCSLPPLHVTVRTERPGLRSVQLWWGQTPLSPGWHHLWKWAAGIQPPVGGLLPRGESSQKAECALHKWVVPKVTEMSSWNCMFHWKNERVSLPFLRQAAK